MTEPARDTLDSAGEIRAGEELDVDGLTAYLQRAGPGGSSRIEVRQFRQGHSNLTYLVIVDGAEYVLRRPPFGNKVKTAHDMGREFRVLSALAPVFAPAPRPLLICDDESVLGAPFYLMERRHGIVIRQSLPVGLTLSPELASRLCRTMVDTMAALHAIDYHAVGLTGFGKPEGYVARQVRGWTERYHAAQTDPLPDFDAVAAWLAANMPPERGAAVIHNDFKFDNVMLDGDDPARITAVLDWEMATVGDPLMDLGTSLAYWAEATDPEPARAIALGPTAAPGMWTRAELIRAYAERSGIEIGNVGFYHAYGLFKLAVVLQQIYARYARGFTRDERFSRMNRTVEILFRNAAAVAERGML